MKILMAIHHFPPRYIAGAEKDALRIAHGLIQRGHAVQVLCVESTTEGPEEGISWSDDVYEGIPVRRLFFQAAGFSDAQRYEYDNPLTAHAAGKLIEETNPDLLFLVSGYLMSGSVLREARDRGLPAVIYMTDFWYICWRTTKVKTNDVLCPFPAGADECAACMGMLKRRYRYLHNFMPGVMRLYWRMNTQARNRMVRRRQQLLDDMKSARFVITQSKFLRDKMTEAGLPSERIFNSRNGLEVIEHPWDEARHYPNRLPFHLGYMGQISYHKGVHLIVEALKMLPELDIKLSLYGDTESFPDYTKRLRQLIGADSRITLMGPYNSREEMVQAYQSQDATVVPSIYYENSPNSILEAKSFHLPVITSAHGGMQEMIVDGVDGFLFAPDDPADLKEKIRRLVTEPGLYQKIVRGTAPPRHVSTQVDEIELLLNQALKDTRSDPQRFSPGPRQDEQDV